MTILTYGEKRDLVQAYRRVSDLDMFPAFPQDDMANRRLCNAIRARKAGLIFMALCVESTNLYYGAFVQLGLWVTCAFYMPFRLNIFHVASLLEHVLCVVFLAAEKQVFGVYAAANIAFMQYADRFGDRAVMEFPSYAVAASVCGHAAGKANVNSAVAVNVQCPRPYPTRPKFGTRSWAVLVNLVPETNCKWYLFGSHDLNLRDRFELWLGSLTAPTVCGPFSLGIIT